MSTSRTHMLESVCCIRKFDICVHLPCYCVPYLRDISEVEYILKRQHQRSQLLNVLLGWGEDSFWGENNSFTGFYI
jgi:hypothetical protein